MPHTYLEKINQIALAHSLRPDVVTCVIIQESNNNPFAIRYEPNFFIKYLKGKTRSQLSGFVPSPIPTLDTELQCRSMSWGLMQIMGETARSIGHFTNPYLSSLVDPEQNIEVGCRVLSYYYGKHQTYEKALAAYNAGTPNSTQGQHYAIEVIERLQKGEHRSLLID